MRYENLVKDQPCADATIGTGLQPPRWLRFARNDTSNGCHCEERSDEAISTRGSIAGAIGLVPPTNRKEQMRIATPTPPMRHDREHAPAVRNPGHEPVRVPRRRSAGQARSLSGPPPASSRMRLG